MHLRKVDRPKGLIIVDGFLRGQELADLEQLAAALEWDGERSKALSRRTIHFGFEYDYGLREPRCAKLTRSAEPPRPLARIGEGLVETSVLPDTPNQIIVNRYEPGQGISKHRDHAGVFGGSIASLSLGSAAAIVFRPRAGPKSEKVELLLHPGTLLVMSGPARMDWTHEIPARKSDAREGGRVARSRRYSVTYRSVLPDFQGAAELPSDPSTRTCASG